MAAVAPAAGCGGLPTAEQALEEAPLPFKVGIFIDADAAAPHDAPPAEALTSRGGGGGGGAGDGSDAAKAPPAEHVRFLLDDEALTRALSRAISRDAEVVTMASSLGRMTRAQAAHAAEKRGLDILIAAKFETRPDYDGEYGFSPAWTALEVATWLFGGVPAWFVPSVEYDTRTHLDVEALDPRASSSKRWAAAFEKPTDTVSLWDRSHPFDRPLDYLATIIVPPLVLVPGDKARLSASLTADTTAALGAQLAVVLRQRIVEQERKAPLSVVFLTPDPRRLAGEGDLPLAFAVKSTGAGGIASVEVGASAAKHVWSWKMPAESLEELRGKIREFGGKPQYAVCETAVPGDVGDFINISVRVVRDDGLEVKRVTAVRRR